ncbi:AAA family ATPase [Dongia sp.]|uniref:AAA family ATPase n=1 Tax=Dongia sp. TaxID=1977262 RepID=UPI0035AF40A0
MAAEADNLSLFFEILDGRADQFVYARKVRKAIEADKTLRKDGRLAQSMAAFEASMARGHGEHVVGLLLKSVPRHHGLIVATRLLMARYCGDPEAELHCGQLLLNTYFLNDGLAPEVRTKRLMLALGFFASASGASAMQHSRLAVGADDQHALHGYRLAADVKGARLSDDIFDKLVDHDGFDNLVMPGDRLYDGWSGNALCPHSQLPARLCGTNADELYLGGHANTAIAAGALATKIKARLPFFAQLADNIINDPKDVSHVWTLVKTMRGQTEFDVGEEVEALLFAAAQGGDRKAMYQSAGYALRRGYHDANKTFLVASLGMLAVASGARLIEDHDEYGNVVDTAIGHAGKYLFEALVAHSEEESKTRHATALDSFMDAERQIGAERRADAKAETEVESDADRVIEDGDPLPTNPHAHLLDGNDWKNGTPRSKGPLSSLKARALAKFQPESVVVIKNIGNGDVASTDMKMALKAIESFTRPTPLAPMPADLSAWRQSLLAEFPHCSAAIDAVHGDLQTRAMNGKKSFEFRPTLLVGSPGTGKSRLARRIAEASKIGYKVFPCGGVSDAHFGGVSRGWHSSHPSAALDLIRSSTYPNPIMILDEIEKAATSRHSGNLMDVILAMLEPETGRSWVDPFIQGPIDVSHVNWIFTANSVQGLSPPLLDRLRIIHVDQPGLDHLPALSATILKELSTSQGHTHWHQPLDQVELNAIAKAWQRQPSIRYLRRLIEGALRAREMSAARH